MASSFESAALAVLSGIVTASSFLLYSVIYLVTLLIWPVSALLSLLAILLSPVFYTVSYLLAPVFFFYSVMPNLKPLYIFFGSAAFVGIIAGVSLSVTSSIIVGLFGMRQTAHDREQLIRLTRDGIKTDSEEHSSDSESGRPGYDPLLLSSQDSSDWLVLDRIASEPNIRRRRSRGPLTQTTIHEEEDSL